MKITAKVKTVNGETFVMDELDIGCQSLNTYTDSYIQSLKNAKFLTIYTENVSKVIPFDKVNSIEIYKV